MKTVAVLVLVVSCSALINGQTSAVTSGRLRLSLVSKSVLLVRHIGTDLYLRIDRDVDAHGRHMGWEVSVKRGTGDRRDEDVLLPVRSQHGPFDTDVLAWSAREQYFPDERRLWIANPPTEIIIQLLNYATTTPDDVYESSFTKGVLVVKWRPVRQIPEIVR
jgi:hypothetical protein